MRPAVLRSSGRSAGNGDAHAPGAPHLRRLSYLLDNSIKLPGGYRIGIDPLLGLIPGLGDAVGTALSAYIIMEAARLGAPRLMLTRMVFNVAVESIIGVIPVLGDLFDAAWKANARNYAMLAAHMGEPAPPVGTDKRVVWLILAVLAVIVLVVLGLSYLVISLIVAAFAA